MKSLTRRARPLFPRTYRPSRATGFTLIELMACVSIVLIVTTLSTTTFPELLQKRVETTAFDTLYHLVAFTRTKAIREQETMTLCASDNNIDCDGDWNRHVIIFSDANKNARVDGSEVLFKTITLPGSTPCVKWNVGLNRPYLRFKPDGTNAGTAGNFHFCDPGKTHIQKKLVVSFTGRTSIQNL